MCQLGFFDFISGNRRPCSTWSSFPCFSLSLSLFLSVSLFFWPVFIVVGAIEEAGNGFGITNDRTASISCSPSQNARVGVCVSVCVLVGVLVGDLR